MPVKGMVMTEMQKLKIKKTKGTATAEDLTRLKLLQDGEPLSATDLAEAKKREEERVAKDKADFEARQDVLVKNAMPEPPDLSAVKTRLEELNVPPDHPRIAELKQALMPFTQIEAHNSRPNEFVLFTRGVAITAGDVRKARKAMKI